MPGADRRPEFVWHMEDVLAVYARPSTQRARSSAGRDEPAVAGRTRPPQPRAGAPGAPRPRIVRGGVANVFRGRPLRGRRYVLVGDQRTRLDWARCVKDLVDVHYRDADRIVLVLDHLNTHTPASLYATFRRRRRTA